MSTDEQDLLLGRLIREQSENRATIAALEVKLQGFGMVLKDAADLIDAYVKFRMTEADAQPCIERLPQPGQVIETFRELLKERERAEHLKAQVAKFGLRG